MLLSAPVWPSGLTWADKYIILSGTVLAGIDIFVALSGFIFNWFVGYLYTNHGPDSIFYYMFIMACIMCVLILIMQIVASTRGMRQFSKPISLNRDTVSETEEKVDAYGESDNKAFGHVDRNRQDQIINTCDCITRC